MRGSKITVVSEGFHVTSLIRAGFMIELAEGMICDEQSGFRRGRGCVDQRQVCKKYLAKGKDVFWAFMDLEKAYTVKPQLTTIIRS